MFIIQNNNDLLHSSYTPTHFLECGTPPINIDLILENAGGILSLSLSSDLKLPNIRQIILVSILKWMRSLSLISPLDYDC